MRRKLISFAKGKTLEIGLGTAEKLPFEGDSFDTVISALTFCSIPDYQRAFFEAKRVLKPNGKLLLLEHVRRAGFIGILQDALTPFWKAIAGGCHLNRELDDLVTESGLKVIEYKSVWNGLGRYWVLEK